MTIFLSQAIDEAEHCKNLEAEAGFHLKLVKCKFMLPSGEFLGYVSGEGLQRGQLREWIFFVYLLNYRWQEAEILQEHTYTITIYVYTLIIY